MADYLQVVAEAAGLLDPSEWEGNAEYLRGMCELIARVFPVLDDTESDAGMARMNIALILGVDS